MPEQLKITLAQTNSTVGAIAENSAKIRAFRADAAARGADLVIFPEQCVAGYPSEDLVRKPAFQAEAMAAVEALAGETADGGPAIIVGAPRKDGDKLYNSLFLLDGGKIAAVRDKRHLPNYGVFDEIRVFDAAGYQPPVEFRGMKMGLMICEDMWFPDVPEMAKEQGADVIVAPNASPYELGKLDQRMGEGRDRVAETGLPLIMVNLVGGQDELVFDGTSYVMASDGTLAARLATFTEQALDTFWTRNDGVWRPEMAEIAEPPEGDEKIYSALVLGLRDYVAKNRFPGVVIGMSGGIDSALTAAIAVDALGPEAVHCVMMPSRYTSAESVSDATECARLLGAEYRSIAIEPMVGAFDEALADLFAGAEPDTTEENIQARIRGVLLMAHSNKFGHMLLATGNKSEMSVGYATLYGDPCGGFALLKDVYKTTVFALSRWRNAHVPVGGLGPTGAVIPENIITKPPSAELKEDQKDEDSLPPYDALDDMLQGLVEDELSVAEVAARGHDAAVVARIEHMLYVAEYKRRQAPPGVKITRKQFGRDRRYPITNAFRDSGSDSGKRS